MNGHLLFVQASALTSPFKTAISTTAFSTRAVDQTVVFQLTLCGPHVLYKFVTHVLP